MVELTPQAIALLNSIAGAGDLRHMQRDSSVDVPVTGPWMHGPGGLFNIPGANQDVFSTRLVPQGLGSRIPAVASMYAAPEYLYITGFKAATGSDPDGPCDDPRTAGPIMNCLQRAQFGRQSLQTRSMEINRNGLLTNRAEPMDFRVVNDTLAVDLGKMLAPSSTTVSMQRALGSEVLMRWLEVGQEMQETLLPMVYTGNPTNNSAGGGTKEFAGLNLLISHNKVDAETGTPCPTLRSLLEDFDFADVNDSGGQSMVDMFASVFYRLRHIASRSRMGEVDWRVVMRPGAFYAMTRTWPCSYYTAFCDVSANNQAVVNVAGTDMANLRDDMYNNRYLLVDGVRIPVILDDAIPEYNGDGDVLDSSNDDGCYSSDIYIVPLSVRGGYNVLRWEYLDYKRGAMVGAREGHYDENTFWTDDGVWLWTKKPNQLWCVQWAVKTEPRLVLLTPHLAARISNVQYCYTHERAAMRSDYHYEGGGVENRPAGSLYGEWATTTPVPVA